MQVRAIVDNTVTKIVSPQGLVVPSFIIMGQGLPFDEWIAAISPDFPLALQVTNRAIALADTPVTPNIIHLNHIYDRKGSKVSPKKKKKKKKLFGSLNKLYIFERICIFDNGSEVHIPEENTSEPEVLVISFLHAQQ